MKFASGSVFVVTDKPRAVAPPFEIGSFFASLARSVRVTANFLRLLKSQAASQNFIGTVEAKQNSLVGSHFFER